jgi:DNA repair protein RadD
MLEVMMITLRDYQQDLIARTREALRGSQQVLMQAPTGAGKTALACHMMQNAVNNGHSCMFLVHQNELLQQTSRAMWRNQIAHGMVTPSRVRTPHPVQVASIMTLKNRLKNYKEPALIIIDEAHRAVANTYQDILKAYPAAKVVGLTATPQRTDGKGLNHIFSDIVQGPSIRYLIEQGYLCDYQLYGTPQTLDLSNVRTTAGDFNAGDIQREAEKPKVVGDAIDHYLKFAYGKRCVVMCATIKQAESMAKAYKDAGVPAGCIHGNTKNREEVLAQFAAGEILVLTSVQLLIEGVDIPEIGAVQWLRPTKSIVVYMQGNGRGLRPHDDKDYLVILDHVGNWQRHGLPCEERTWSLEGDKNQGRKKADPDAIGVQTCEQCFSAFRTGVHECPYCGHGVQFKERKIDIIDGELEAIKKAAEVEREKLEARKEQGRARELSELVQIGINRKMRNPSAWAANVFAARQGRKASSDDYARARQLMAGAV